MLVLGDVYVATTVADGLTDRLQTAQDTGSPALLQAAHVDHETSHAGSDVPDVLWKIYTDVSSV